MAFFFFGGGGEGKQNNKQNNFENCNSNIKFETFI